MYIYNNERDPVTRGIINLATAQIEFSEESQAMIKVSSLTHVVFDTSKTLDNDSIVYYPSTL